MSGQGAVKANDGIEVIEIATDSSVSAPTPAVDTVEPSLAPAIRPSRRRPQVVTETPSPEPEFLADNAMQQPPAPEQHDQQERFTRAPGEPPPFTGILQLEPKDLKQWQKALKAHKKNTDMKKLCTLDYFIMHFSEIAYFEVSPDVGALVGVLGYGNMPLVTQIQNHHLSDELLPSLFEHLSSLNCYLGPVQALRAEDQQGLAHLGFQSVQSVGAFPVTYKKSITGLWLCTASDDVAIPDKEMAALKKQLSGFVF